MSDIDRTMGFIKGFTDKALSQSSNLANRLSYASGSNKSISFRFDPKKPSMEKPPRIGDLLDDHEKKDVNLMLLNEAAEAWIAKFMPNISQCLSMQPEEWACSILSGREEYGMNKAAFDAAWHEGRDRAYRQANSEKAQIDASYSLRGFSLPQGAHVFSNIDAEIRASDAVADINRQQTIKDAEIKLELIKLAATTAAQIKTSLMSMMASFFGNIVQLANHEPGADKMRAKAQAYSAFMSGLSSHYNVELGFEQLRLDAAKTKASTDQVNVKLNSDLAYKGMDSRNTGLAQAAKGFAEAAGSAANAASSLQAELFSGQM